MIFAAIVLLAVVALAPLALALGRQTAGRGRRDSALSIHRGQLVELDRDLAEGRIAAAEHETARLELQRRMLATAELAEPVAARASRLPLFAALLLVPVAAVALYYIDGHPTLPAAPLAGRREQAARDSQRSHELVAQLRQKLATLDPKSDMARKGYVLLGNAEDSLGELPEAAEAWRHALEIRFEPYLAALTAEAQTQVAGHVSPESADLFRRALAEGPADAPWRKVAEQRLQETAKD
jgi:cytochrome c-type biogenesis protein CcmH